MSMFDTIDQAWSLYTRALEKFAGDPGGSQILQVNRLFTPVEFLTKHKELNLYNKLMVANTLPNWHPTYAPSSGGIISEGYYRFLIALNATVIDSLPEASRKVLNTYFERTEKDRKKYEGYVTGVDSKWRKEKKEDPKLFRDEWERKFGYDTEMAMLRQTLDDSMGRYLIEANKNPAVLRVARAFGFFNAVNAQMRLPEAEELADPVDKDSWGRYYKTFIDGDFSKFATEEFVKSVSFSEKTEHSVRYESSWRGSGSISYGFFNSIGGGASGGSVEEHVRKNTTSIEMSFKNLAPFTVRRSNWFDATLIREFHRRLDYDTFWGPSGVLHLIPTMLVFGRGLKATLALDNYTRDEFHTWREAHGDAGFNIGGWSIGGSVGSTSRSDQVDVKKEDGKVVFEDKTNNIYLVAVISERPGDFGLYDSAYALSLYKELDRLDAEDASKIKSKGIVIDEI
jgi:hypothetical protein